MFWDFGSGVAPEISIGYCFAVASATAGDFKMMIAEALPLVTTAAAFSASLGFLTLGLAFVGIIAFVRVFSGSAGYKGPSRAAAAAASPRVDVEKGPQAAAALGYVDESSQVTSR